MRRPLLFASLAILVAIPPAQFLSAADPLPIPPNAPTGAELITKIRADVQWLSEVDSLHIDATAISINSKEKISNSLQQLRRMHPDRKEFPLQEFTELLPEIRFQFQIDYDSERIRISHTQSTPQGDQLFRQVDFWDGEIAVHHMTYPRNANVQGGFALNPNYDHLQRQVFLYLNSIRQPIHFWWESSNFEQANNDYYGSPEDYILVDREQFHGVDCYVLLKLGGWSSRNRHYVGVDDGRWYGYRAGVISLTHTPELSDAYARVVSDFLGRKMDASSGPQKWEAANAEIDQFEGQKRIDWAKALHKKVVRHYVPVFECWFGEHKTFAPGCVLPSVDTLVFYDAKGANPPYVATTRTLKINNLTIDQPLDDKLFEESPAIGTRISDYTHDPPLTYKYKESFTQEEWEEILESGRQWKQKQQKDSRKGLRKYGKPVRELPQATWLNSKPLSWKDLRGKVVVLHFFSIDEPDSLTDIDSLQTPLENDEDLLERAAKQGLKFPIVTIGIHAPDTPLKKIRKVIDERKLQAPIVQDEATKDIVGKFAEACGVTSFPTSIAFDESGNLLAIGSMKEILDLVKNYTQPPDK
ncbi:MAG: TlpA family protein disulfide reductase [Planctomycetaceae bacterium]|nr:TlpA family protein disulfide reductase [Planctomycetaceae bacterium]